MAEAPNCPLQSQCLFMSQPPQLHLAAALHPNEGHHVGRSAPGSCQRGEGGEYSQFTAIHHPCPHCWRRNCKSAVFRDSYVSLLMLVEESCTWAPKLGEIISAVAAARLNQRMHFLELIMC